MNIGCRYDCRMADEHNRVGGAVHVNHQETVQCSLLSTATSSCPQIVKGFDATKRNSQDISTSQSLLSEKSLNKLKEHDEDNIQKILRIKDHGYAWVIVFSSFFTNCLNSAYNLNFGLIYAKLLAENPELDQTKSGIILGVLSGVRGLGAPFINVLITLVGHRTSLILAATGISASILIGSFVGTIPLYVVFLSLIPGIASCIGDLSQVVYIPDYFDEKLAIATGLRTFGHSFGGIVFALIYDLLLENYGLQTTLVAISCFFIFGIANAALIRPIDTHVRMQIKKYNKTAESPLELPPKKSSTRKETKPLDFSLLCNPSCVLYLFVNCMRGLGTPCGIFFLPLLGKFLGFSSMECSILLSYIAAVDGVSRILLGWLVEKITVPATYLYVVGLSLGGFGLLLVPSVSSFGNMFLPLTFYAMGNASYVVLFNFIVSNHFGANSVGSAYAFCRFTLGISTLLFPPFLSWIYKLTGNYTVPYLFMGCGTICSGLCALLEIFITRKHSEQDYS